MDAPELGSAKALMTFPRAERLVLMALASFSRVPLLIVRRTRSLPARSRYQKARQVRTVVDGERRVRVRVRVSVVSE